MAIDDLPFLTGYEFDANVLRAARAEGSGFATARLPAPGEAMAPGEQPCRTLPTRPPFCSPAT